MFKFTLILSASVFLLSVVVALSTAPLFRRTKRGLSPNNLLILGTFLSLSIFFFPISFLENGGVYAPVEFLTALVAALVKGLSTFLGEGDYFDLMSLFEEVAPAELMAYYRPYAVILHAVAPLLTFGFVLSFVKNLSAMARYRVTFLRTAHIFSELNEHSLALAESILRTERRLHLLRPVIVFTDIQDGQEGQSYELVSKSERLGAILLRKDLASIRFRLFPFGRRLCFYLLQDKQVERREGEGEKLRYAAHIMQHYDERGVTLYLFSGSKESEMFLEARAYRKKHRFTLFPWREAALLEAALLEKARARVLDDEILSAKAAADGKPVTPPRTLENALGELRREAALGRRAERSLLFGMYREWEELCSLMPSRQRVLRLDDVRSLIYHNLDLYGHRLFENAGAENGNEIHSVIVGLGQYGTEMLRALSWYAQVPGFTLRITAFDEDRGAEDRLRLAMPELMARADALAGGASPECGEANCHIRVFGDVDVESAAFYKALSGLERVTHVFVALGSDKRNIAVATAIRAHFHALGAGDLPDIETVVYDSAYAEMMGIDPGAEAVRGYEVGANVRRQPYRIHMLGDVDSFYSVETLLNSEMLDAGLHTHIRYSLQYARITAGERLGLLESLPEADRARFADEAARLRGEIDRLTALLAAFYEYCYPAEHLAYCKDATPMSERERRALIRALRKSYESGFFTNEYNHRSSLAKALGERIRLRLVREGYLETPHIMADGGRDPIPEVFKPWDARDAAALREIGATEHIRWNAYMRSEGYVYGEATNHLTKRHRDLRNVNRMSDDDLRKDA